MHISDYFLAFIHAVQTGLNAAGYFAMHVLANKLFILVMPVTCITSRFCTHLGGSAFGPPTFFTILTDSGVLTGCAVPKRVG